MIFALLNDLKKQSFTGIAHVRTKSDDTRIHWKIYFNDGQLIWADGGVHSHRAWQRHLNKYCSQIDLKQVNFRNSEQYRCFEYHCLDILIQRKLTTTEIIRELVFSKIIEVFFELFQQEKSIALELTREPLTLTELIGKTTGYPLISIEIKIAFKEMQQHWSAWVKSGFTSIDPNYALRIKSKEQLIKSVPAIVYQNFTKLMDGRRSLRDLAVRMNKDLLLLTKSIYPYVYKGLLELVEVPDRDMVSSNGIISSQVQTNSLPNH